MQGGGCWSYDNTGGVFTPDFHPHFLSSGGNSDVYIYNFIRHIGSHKTLNNYTEEKKQISHTKILDRHIMLRLSRAFMNIHFYGATLCQGCKKTEIFKENFLELFIDQTDFFPF